MADSATDDLPTGNTPSDAQPSIDDVIAEAKKLFPQYNEDQITSTIADIQKQNPKLTNQDLMDSIPALKASMADGSFQKAVVQKAYSDQQSNTKSGIGPTGTLPQQQANATAPIAPLQQDASQGQVPLWAAGAAGARYPEQNAAMVAGATQVANQNLKSQAQANANQQQQIAAQTNAQNNVGYQQGQQITQQKLDPNSDLNKWFRGQIQSLSPNTPVPPGLTVAAAGDNTEKFISAYNTQYGMSGLPAANSSTGKQVADISPADLTTAKTAAKDALTQFSSTVTPLLKDGGLPQAAATAALTIANSTDPSSKEYQAANAYLNANGYGSLVGGIHSLLTANDKLNGAGGTDFGLKTALTSMITINNPKDMATSVDRTINNINNKVDEQLGKKTNFYSNRGFVNNNTVPNNPVQSTPSANVGNTNVTSTHKTGDTRTYNGKTYTRQDNGNWVAQ